ncbi:MAG TPA: TfuA domain-containing protein [Rhizomicrobium sp.]|nr:TfuA domain-containing protein [Rhizomicrobium sp.]
MIGIIDGCFEAGPAVWHKEVLWALTQGIHVFGAASMGALRAAELDSFGMRGVGAVYEAFRTGALQDDDEVAVMHAPVELGYRPLTEAMVDIRATIVHGVTSGRIAQRTGDLLIHIAKRMFFKDRIWPGILELAGKHRLMGKDLTDFPGWLAHNRVEQKRLDALEMVQRMEDFLAGKPPPFRPRFVFQHTLFWQALIEERGKAGGS